MNGQIHISSIVVTADPARIAVVEQMISGIQIAEVALVSPPGKLIVTLETTNETEMVQVLTDIQLMPGVVSAALVYHQTTNAIEAAAIAGNQGELHDQVDTP